MSLSLDINNFCEDEIYPRLSSACNDFDNFLAINKNFLENANFDNQSANHCAVTNRARVGHHQSSFFNTNCYHPNYFHDSSSSTANSKDSKVGTLNVYNKCVFFVNKNNKPNTNTNQWDIPTSNLCIKKHSRDNLFESKFNRHHNNNSLFQTNFESQSFPSTAKSIDSVDSNLNFLSKTFEKHQSKKLKQHKLFFSHNNELKPIISPMIKSGVYRKLYTPDDIITPSSAKSNVCLSTTDICGKVVTLENFRKNYVEEETKNPVETVTKNDIEFISYSPPYSPLQFPSKSTRKLLCGTKVEVKALDSSSHNELNTFAQSVLSLGKESNSIIVDREKNEIIYKNPVTKKRLRYRLIRPDRFDDIRNSNQDNSPDSIPNIQDCLLPFCNPNKVVSIPKPSRRGRPRKIHRKSTTSAVPANQVLVTQQQNNPVVMAKTRYGRLSKLPNHIQEDFKVSVNEMRNTYKELEIRNEIDDKDYKCDKESTKISTAEELIQNYDPKARKERNIPPEYQCKVCNKIFLGKRMQRHYEMHPDHDINRNQDKLFTEMSLYKFLVKKIKLSSASAENRTDIFLNEISDLVEQLQSRSSRFVQNTSGMHFVNSRTSKVLGIPEGHYRIDVDEIDAPPDPRIEENSNLIPPPAPRLDYNLSISLDDTIADAKLNMITSDDSLLRTVNDLMEEGIKNLTGGDMDNAVHHHHRHQTPVIHYDHASDNAVEAVSIKETQPPALLDLSLDLFQFNSN